MYPNPTTSIVHITGLHANSTITIYSIQGEQIERFSGVNQKEFDIDIADYKSGVFVLSIQGSIKMTNLILLKTD